jgi:hypothetical protein
MFQSKSASQSKLDTHLVSLTAPASFAAEQYQGLRLTLERLGRARTMQVVAVTSPGPETERRSPRSTWPVRSRVAPRRACC